MDFRQHIRTQITPAMHGVEIGASYSPIAPKAQGYRTKVVDHAPREELIVKYRDVPGSSERIEEVDAIDDGGELSSLSEDGKGFDYIIASHVLEHMPNPIHFLQRAERALSDSGRLYLLLPDKRYCFDYLRPLTSCGAWVEAYLENHKTHSRTSLFDHHAYNASKQGSHVWADAAGNDAIHMNGTAEAGFGVCTLPAEKYVDCHAWVFTPSSFQLILADLRRIGLIRLGVVENFGSIGCEFFIVLGKGNSSSLAERERLAHASLQEQVYPELNLFSPPAQPSAAPARPESHDALYERRPPSPQNALDLFAGRWNSIFDANIGVSGGQSPLHADHRLDWVASQLGPRLNNMDILELGPLEAAHTRTLLNLGARHVTAIEANKQSFLKCLVAKELYQLHQAHFLLGDFMPYLQASEHRWDMIFACGVLYHMTQPVELLELVAARTDVLYLWTHFVSDEFMPHGDPRRQALGQTIPVQRDGVSYQIVDRPYQPIDPGLFCGGTQASARWMQLTDILDILRRAGFTRIEQAHLEKDNPHGPAISLLALRN